MLPVKNSFFHLHRRGNNYANVKNDGASMFEHLKQSWPLLQYYQYQKKLHLKCLCRTEMLCLFLNTKWEK